MNNKIIAEIPINKLGYSKHAFLLLKQFILKNECKLIPINGQIDFPDFLKKDQEFFAKTKECLSTDINTPIAFKFWHEHDLIIKNNCPVKIGFTTFEVEHLQINTNCNLIMTASSWGKDVLEKHRHFSLPVFGFLPLDFKTSKSNILENNYLHIGKYELRKMTAELIRLANYVSGIAYANQVFNIVCNNPFVSNNEIHQLIKRHGFNEISKNKYLKKYCQINVYPDYISEEELLHLKQTCKQIYLGGSEGANLSLLEILPEVANRNMPIPIFCPTTAHSDIMDYLNTDFTYLHSKAITQIPAFDGIFFKDINTQNIFYYLQYDKMINSVYKNRYLDYDLKPLNTIDNIFYNLIQNECWKANTNI